MNVFVSHADADKEIARLLVVLIEKGIGNHHVFCSSSKGAIPNGDFFIQYILSALDRSEGTISLLSSNYLKSQFCIAELGSAIIAQFRRSAFFNSFIIPPTRFNDLVGMHLGIQSATLDEEDALNALCVRLKGNPADSTWVNARGAFRQAVQPIVNQRKAEELLSQLVIHDFRAEPTDLPTVIYKSKIRVQLKNNTGQQIEVRNPSWSASGTEVPLQVPPQNCEVLQLEGPKGWHKEDWTTEAAEITVPAGAVFRLWFGLHQAFAADELRRRHEGQLLGKLRLQVRIAKIDLNWEKQL